MAAVRARQWLVALAIVALVGGGLLLMRSLATPAAPDDRSAPHELEVIGRDGTAWNVTVPVPVATPLQLLEAGAILHGTTIDWEDQPGFGGCGGRGGWYVTRIGSDAETGAGGWNYYIKGEGATEWQWQPVGPACLVLQPGDAVQWRWVQ